MIYGCFMGKYKIKHFEAPDVYTLEAEVNKFLEQNENKVIGVGLRIPLKL